MKATSRNGRIKAAKQAEKRAGGKPAVSKFAARHPKGDATTAKDQG